MKNYVRSVMNSVNCLVVFMNTIVAHSTVIQVLMGGEVAMIGKYIYIIALGGLNANGNFITMMYYTTTWITNQSIQDSNLGKYSERMM